LYLEEIEKYHEKMIKQKEEYDNWKNDEGDSDLIFNQKDNEKKEDL